MRVDVENILEPWPRGEVLGGDHVVSLMIKGSLTLFRTLAKILIDD